MAQFLKSPMRQLDIPMVIKTQVWATELDILGTQVQMMLCSCMTQMFTQTTFRLKGPGGGGTPLKVLIEIP